MFCSALRTLKAHRVGPNESQGRIVNVKLEINGLSGLRAQTNEIAHRVARKMVGNESAEIIGKDFFDSRCLFTRCQSTDGHEPPPFVGIRSDATKQSARNVALLKNLESVAIATQSVARRARCYCLAYVVRAASSGASVMARKAGVNEQAVFASFALNSDAMSARLARSTLRLASRNP